MTDDHRIPYVNTGPPLDAAAIEDFGSRFSHTPLIEVPGRPEPVQSSSLMDRPLPSIDPKSPEGIPIWQKIDAFNAGVGTLSSESLTQAMRQAELDFGSIHPRVIKLFAAADLLAINLQRRLRRRIKLTYLLLGIALVFFALIDLEDIAVIGFVVFLAVAAWLVWGSGTRRLEARFLDSRALAEGLRVALIGGLAVVAEAYADKQGFTHLLTQYQLAHALFKRASELLGTDTDPERVLVDLGREALQENGEWLIYFRSHPVEVRV